MSVSFHTGRGTSSIIDLMNAAQADVAIHDSHPVSSHTSSRDLQGHAASVTRVPFSTKPEQSDESDAQEPVKKKRVYKKRVYKKRKATHTVRKEEKQALEAQMKALEAKLETLKLQALMQQGDDDMALNKKMAHNLALRDVVQGQHLVLAHTQGMMLSCTLRHSYEVCPTEMFIHLTADRAERHKTLQALKEPKLECARRFILERSRGMHPTAEYFHEEKYETPDGDFCNVRFDRVPLRGVRGGVRAVLNALRNAAFNAEIIISEMFGYLTIREDDDLSEDDFSQLRLVTQTRSDILVENNLIHFTDFSPGDGGKSYAITAAEFVNEDERFPYRPHERVRRNATSAILVTSHFDTKTKYESDLDIDGGHTSSEEEGEPIIVITRWAFTRICRTELDVPVPVLREMRDLSGRDKYAYTCSSTLEDYATWSDICIVIPSSPLLIPASFLDLPFVTQDGISIPYISSTQLTPLVSGEGWSLFHETQHHQERCEALQVLALAAETGKADPNQGQNQEKERKQNTKKKRVYKKRKSTHTVRKEERWALEIEIDALQSKLEALKLQTMLQRGELNESLDKRQAENSILLDAIQDHHVAVAQAQAMLLGRTKCRSYDVGPTEMYIHLPADQSQRRGILNALQEPKLDYAKRFIQQRSYGLHPTTVYVHEERYETPQGDYCNVHFERTPLRGVRGGIGAVFAAFKHAAFNVEILFSENSDNVTIREDDGLADENFSQMRFVTETARGVLVESNIVHFSDFSHAEEGAGSKYALATADFVDNDELYPYHPNERVRRETTTIVLMTVHDDDPTYRNYTGPGDCEGHTPEEEGGDVVVITRWTFTRICRTDLNVPSELLRKLRALSGQTSQMIFDCICETVGIQR
ncbi:unnamed protein product [Phytophthora fragariaefolia]|uniref:Unnamed protein product n=1 Tax=Phytophthora fragariaefolia TaxID=1490495 RepID=A0A9W6U4K1_9STRA|nr:unnamed protein product [Phytophthora fragariaefolia]